MAASVFSAPRQAPAAMAGINITPLVDVMLVLLIIFMVQAIPKTQDLGLKLPGVVQPDAQSTPPPRAVLSIAADGALSLEGIAVPMQDLRAELAAIRQRDPRTLLAVDASDQADYQRFAQTLATARNAGFEDLAIR